MFTSFSTLPFFPMRFLYALALLAFVAAPASAQLDSEQVPLDRLALDVIGDPLYEFTVTNTISADDFPLFYNAPDSLTSFYVVPSGFERNDSTFTATDTTVVTVSTGTAITTAGVSGVGQIAFTADNDVSVACEATDIVNTADLAGKIAIARRGVCNFTVKFQILEAAGAIGVILVNDDRAEGNLETPGLGGGVAAGEPAIGIPGVLIAFGIGQPLIDEILFNAAEISFRMYDNGDGVAAEEGPATTDSGLELRGANPFRGSTAFRVFTETAEAVNVELFNVRGQLIATLFEGTIAGERAVTLSSADVAPGVYFVRATGETFRKQLQVTIVR